jgi:hypothetical protein
MNTLFLLRTLFVRAVGFSLLFFALIAQTSRKKELVFHARHRLNARGGAFNSLAISAVDARLFAVLEKGGVIVGNIRSRHAERRVAELSRAGGVVIA